MVTWGKARLVMHVRLCSGIACRKMENIIIACIVRDAHLFRLPLHHSRYHCGTKEQNFLL